MTILILSTPFVLMGVIEFWEAWRVSR